MVETISRIQQLLAESKFVEAQKEAEIQLFHLKSSDSLELVELYFESLKAQNKIIPYDLHLAHVEKLLSLSAERAQEWLNQLPKDKIKDQQKLLLIEIQLAEIKGQTELLYHLISQFQILKFELRTPAVPEVVRGMIQKYFPHDFHIQLQKLALELMRMDLISSEKSIKELILSCFERSSPKGTKEKLNSLYEILNSAEHLYHLELYKNLCYFLANGISEKKDYKKLVELVIYLEDFRMQALLLNLMLKEGLEEIAVDYAAEVKQNKDYSYVYFDKFLPHLKPLFFQRKAIPSVKIAPLLQEADLQLTKYKAELMPDDMDSEISDEELLLTHVLKHQNFNTTELLDIAVSFLQSDFYLAALKASQMAFENAESDEAKLKACFLKVTCLLKTHDYRAALDVSLDALSYSKTQNDLLSFLYSQAEAHLRLKEYKAAKSVLKKIISIDAGYRLAKERLDRLNAL